jgi:hypothetical protein
MIVMTVPDDKNGIAPLGGIQESVADTRKKSASGL